MNDTDKSSRQTNSMSALFVVQGGRRHGLGHMMRSLALAQAWLRRGGRVDWLMPQTLQPVVRNRGIDGDALQLWTVGDDAPAADLVNQFLRRHRPGWLVLDGYDFDGPFQDALDLGETRLLVFDDARDRRYPRSDAVVTPGWLANQTALDASQQVLSGPEYVLIRDEFTRSRAPCQSRAPWKRDRRPRIVVTLGGADPANITTRVLRRLVDSLPDVWDIDVILGPCCAHRGAIADAARTAAHNVRLLTPGGAIAQHFLAADLAIASASTTTFELGFLRVPFLAIQTVDNQRHIARSLSEIDPRLSWSTAQLDSDEFALTVRELATHKERRSALSARVANYIDGQGSDRIVRSMLTADFRLRPATAQDSHKLWMWRNNPEVRAVSFQTQPIAWPEHCQWFQRRLDDSDCQILILSDQAGTDVGQVRLDWEPTNREYVLSICMAPGMRGRGLGTALIEAACRHVRAKNPHATVKAIIKPGNSASQAAFRKAGFVPVRTSTVRNQVALQYGWPAHSPTIISQTETRRKTG